MPVTKVRWVAFFPDDWLTGTIDLTHHERSIYITICAGIWSRGGPVEEDYVRKMCPGEHFKRGLDKLIARGKVYRIQTQNGPGLAQKRALFSLETAQERVRNGQVNGGKGGRPKVLAKPAGLSLRARNQKHNQTNNQKEKNTIVPNPAPKRRSYTENAERFWDAYPHRGLGGDPKKPAIEVFEAKVRAGADPEEIILGAERYASDIVDKKLEPRFVPQAQKWLRQEYWCDYVSELGPSQHAPQQSRRPNGLPEDYEEVRRRLEGGC
jgi:hypothetical protein